MEKASGRTKVVKRQREGAEESKWMHSGQLEDEGGKNGKGRSKMKEMTC